MVRGPSVSVVVGFGGTATDDPGRTGHGGAGETNRRGRERERDGERERGWGGLKRGDLGLLPFSKHFCGHRHIFIFFEIDTLLFVFICWW